MSRATRLYSPELLNIALMKKGLRPIPLPLLTNLAAPFKHRPDEEGIKTDQRRHIDGVAAFKHRPDEEGIKTVNLS